MGKRKFTEGLLNHKYIIDLLGVTRGQTILDAGCGNGYMALKFASLVGPNGRVYALDSDQPSINNLEQKQNKPNLISLVGDITKPTMIETKSVDLVYLSTVFHIFSKSQILGFQSEIKRLLKPNGVLAIVNITKEENSFGPPIEMRSSPSELIKKLDLIPLKYSVVGEYFYMQTFENK